MWSEQMTLAHLAYQRGWPKGTARARVRELVAAGVVLRRRVPVASMSTKRRVVYQVALMRELRLL
jgi:hypothetical protein